MEIQKRTEYDTLESAQTDDEQTAIGISHREYWTRARLHLIEESYRTGVDPSEFMFDVEDQVSNAVARYHKSRASELDEELVLSQT